MTELRKEKPMKGSRLEEHPKEKSPKLRTHDAETQEKECEPQIPLFWSQRMVMVGEESFRNGQAPYRLFKKEEKKKKRPSFTVAPYS